MEAATSRDEWQLVELPTDAPVWERVFIPAPLVLVGTKEGDRYDVAPKHMVTPLGWDNYFGFVCTPRHATSRNVAAHSEFTVSFPRANRILHATLAAGKRLADGSKPNLSTVPVFPARVVEGVLVEGCALYLECRLDRVIGGFGENNLIVGKVVAAAARRGFVRDADVDDDDLLERLNPIVYLAPGRWGIVRETYAFPFPIGFRR